MRWLSKFLALFMVTTVHAAYVINPVGRQIHGVKISATEDGAVTLTTASGQQMTFRKGQYRSAAADCPAALNKAEQLLQQGQGKQAVPLLKQVKREYRFLAWDQQAIRQLADYYLSSGQFAEAVDEFQSLENQEEPIVQRKLREALMKSGKMELVLSVLNEDIAFGSRDVAAQAYLLRGELKAENGNVEGAKRDWLKVVTFFKAQKEQAVKAEEKLGEMK